MRNVGLIVASASAAWLACAIHGFPADPFPGQGLASSLPMDDVPGSRP